MKNKTSLASLLMIAGGLALTTAGAPVRAHSPCLPSGSAKSSSPLRDARARQRSERRAVEARRAAAAAAAANAEAARAAQGRVAAGGTSTSTSTAGCGAAAECSPHA